MSKPIRNKLEPGIYERVGADGNRLGLELVFRDAQGKQRRRAVDGGAKAGIMAARAQLATELAKRASGERVAADARLKFDRAADQWVAAHVKRLAPRSQHTTEYNLRHLRERFGRRRLIDITPADIAAYVADKEATHAAKTIRDHLSVLGQIFDYATRRLGFVGANPVAALTRAERPSGKSRKPYVLSSDELPRLLAALEDDYRLLFDLASQTGPRINEALAWAWEDVDLDRMTIAFTHQLDDDKQRVAILKTSASYATLPLGPSMVAKLRAHKLASEHSAPNDLVFTNPRGGPWDDYNISSRVMPRAAKRAGIVVPADKRLSFHALRHAFGSRLIADGCDIAEVQHLMRHENPSTTLTIYTHEIDAARREQERRDRLERIYGDGSGMAAPDTTNRHHPGGRDVAEVAYLRGRRTG